MFSEEQNVARLVQKRMKSGLGKQKYGKTSKKHYETTIWDMIVLGKKTSILSHVFICHNILNVCLFPTILQVLEKNFIGKLKIISLLPLLFGNIVRKGAVS